MANITKVIPYVFLFFVSFLKGQTLNKSDSLLRLEIYAIPFFSILSDHPIGPYDVRKEAIKDSTFEIIEGHDNLFELLILKNKSLGRGKKSNNLSARITFIFQYTHSYETYFINNSEPKYIFKFGESDLLKYNLDKLFIDKILKITENKNLNLILNYNQKRGS